jgi:hypothetical protein
MKRQKANMIAKSILPVGCAHALDVKAGVVCVTVTFDAHWVGAGCRSPIVKLKSRRLVSLGGVRWIVDPAVARESLDLIRGAAHLQKPSADPIRWRGGEGLAPNVGRRREWDLQASKRGANRESHT